jgi:hypothetical protein
MKQINRVGKKDSTEMLIRAEIDVVKKKNIELTRPRVFGIMYINFLYSFWFRR